MEDLYLFIYCKKGVKNINVKIIWHNTVKSWSLLHCTILTYRDW